MTDSLPPVERPNGKPYRPRKISARILVDEDQIESQVLVTGTHDIERAAVLAREEARRVDHRYSATAPYTGWWRETYRDGAPFWDWDEVRGAAGVMFEIGEEAR